MGIEVLIAMSNLIDDDNHISDINAFECPLVCETCLGPNHYIRMQKFPWGGTCHVSGRPYTVFRWKAGSGARYKKTVICQDLARLKNVCQVCMLDLDYNLPVQIRDKAFSIRETLLPASRVGREVALNRLERSCEKHINMGYTNPPNDLLMKLARNEPCYKRNQPRTCSFFTKGCNRGLECPFRHTAPIVSELSKQSYCYRYHGVNDPVAKKMLARATNMSTLKPPNDSSITTLFIGNITSRINADHLTDALYTYGEVKTI